MRERASGPPARFREFLPQETSCGSKLAAPGAEGGRTMHAFRRLIPAALALLALVLVLSGSGTIAAAESSGLADKKPIVAAACAECPWGTIAQVLKQALQPHGYDLQICYTCSRGDNPRIVTGDVKPPPTDPEGSPTPPAGPIDFGITSGANLWAAYQGAGRAS